MKKKCTFLGLFLLCASLSFGQLKGVLRNINAKSVLKVVKDETIRQIEKSREDYDPTDFNYAVSFSDNSGVFESEEKFRKLQKGLIYVVSPESMQDRTYEEKAEDYNDVGEILYASGKYNSAEISFKTARFIQENNGLTDTKMGAGVISNLGLIHHTTGRFLRAEELTLQAMQIQNDILNDMHGYGASLNNLAVLYKDMGRFNEAGKLFNQAIKITLETKGEKSSAMAIVRNNNAILLQVLGKYQDAEKEMIKAINLASDSFKEKSPNYVRMKVNLALLYQLQEQYDKAERIYLEAIKLKKRRLGTSHPDYAVMLRNLASLYMEKGETDEVEDLLNRAIQIFKKKFGVNHPVYASALTDLSRFYLSQNNPAMAKPLINQAFSVQQTTLGGHHPSINNTRESLAVMNWLEGNLGVAAELYKEVMEEYLYQVRIYFPPMSEYDKTKFWNTLYPRFIRYYNFVLDARENIPSLKADMYNYHISTKALLLNATSKVKNQILNSNDPNLIKQYKEWVDLKKYLSEIYTLSKEEIKEDKINLDSLEYIANEKEKQLSDKSMAFSAGYLQSEVSSQDISKALSEGEACVEFIRLPMSDFSNRDSTIRYVALVLDNSKYQLPEIIVFEDGNQMEGVFAREYRNNMQRGFEKTGQCDIYWGKLKLVTIDHKRIFASLDGVYNQINLNTLQDSSGVFLIDQKEIFYVMNTKEVPSIKKKLGKKIPGKEKAVLLGAPNYAKDFDWDQAKQMPVQELPGTKKEVEEINKQLKLKAWKTQILVGDEAMEEKIKRINNPYLLHIATHGYFLEDRKIGKEKVFGIEPDQAMENPLLRSGLLFTGADNTIQSIGKTQEGMEDDGVLNAYESLFLDLDKTELVVLSACETGLGEIRNGEGVYGLQRAFQIAGASSLMISLWQVSDEVTQKLMSLFYKQWLATGNKYSAFKYAQNEIKKAYPAPFYWGAFIMINN